MNINLNFVFNIDFKFIMAATLYLLIFKQIKKKEGESPLDFKIGLININVKAKPIIKFLNFNINSKNRIDIRK